MSNDNLDIFISTHKDYKFPVNNSCYKVIIGENNEINTTLDVIKDIDTEITPREFSYAEGSRLFYIWKKYPMKDYVGLCHYRSYFSFMDNIPNLDELFKSYRIITTEKLNLKISVEKHYKNCHIISTLYEIRDILIEKHPELESSFNNFLNQNYLYARNMFIMKSSDFISYCEFVFGILLEFDKRNGLVTTEDVREYVTGMPNVYNDFYQSRLEGFLLERLTSFYIMYFFKENEIKEYPMNNIEDMPDWSKEKELRDKPKSTETPSLNLSQTANPNVKTCILLTGCVNPDGMTLTTLQDPNVRQRQYKEAIDFYLKETKSKIVFVENSMTDFSSDYKEYIESGRLEFLVFQGNNYDKKLGKGFGEAKIIKHACLNSKILNESDYVVKITGRLKVDNINSILNNFVLKREKNVFLCDFREGDLLWSMVFVINPQLLKEIILKNGPKINDSKNVYFEHVLYKSILVRKNVLVLPFAESPDIDGICGTSGESYKDVIRNCNKNYTRYDNDFDENLYQIAKFYLKSDREKEFNKVKEYVNKIKPLKN